MPGGRGMNGSGYDGTKVRTEADFVNNIAEFFQGPNWSQVELRIRQLPPRE
jgi:hypothetical protein